ncbi:MAG: hypothetical protein LBE82_00700, partial [Chitinophagaceae bacterium]|nr:hypothetical protein [Chitinophagaceae bacterium]
MNKRNNSVLFCGAMTIGLLISGIAGVKAQEAPQYYEPEIGFPYVSTLNGSPPGVIIEGADNAADTTNNDGVRLTPDDTNKEGYFFMHDAKFDTRNGVHIEFEYSFGPNTEGGADGLSMILYNGDGIGNAEKFN